MASLKFIMDVDDDQPDPPPSTGDGRDSTRNIAPPHSSGQATPSQIYPSHVSGSDQATRQTSRTAIATVAGSRRAPASTRNSDAPSALTTAAQSSTRRRSTASNDSMDHAGYGSAASSSSVGAGLNPSNSPMRPMSSATSSDVPVKYTPITGRVSRARKGVPVHICEICRPPKTFTRAEHLRRHQLSHQTPGYPCTYPGCDRAFHRPDLLARHLSRHTEPEGDSNSAVTGGGEDDGQSTLAERGSHLDLANQAGSSSGMSVGQGMSSNPSVPPSESPSTPNLSTNASNLQHESSPGAASNASPSPAPLASGQGGYGFSSQGPHDTHYPLSPAFSVINPSSNIRSSSMAGGTYSTVVDSFQQPRTTPSVFATQGVSLPSLSIPESNPPELYHPDASPWASSASDSTYSTPASDNARNTRLWLGRHRSPTGEWPSTHLLSPYPNPTSRDPSSASVDSIAATAPPSMFANPFPPSDFSTMPHNPNYSIMLDVPMTGFGPAQQGGQQTSSPSSEMTFRPHHRHSTSLSSIRTAAPQTSGLLITPMQAFPDRAAAMNTLNRQKEHLMNMTNSHETFMSGGVGFNILGDFGGSFGDISPGGTGSAGGLLAALDLPMTGCGMSGVVLSSQQLPRQVLAAVPSYIEVYWQFFHKLYPIVHRSSFESAGEDVLRCAMAAVATQYLDTKEDRLRGNQLHEHAWQELKRIPQWSLQVMQAILLCEIFARFRGRKAVTRPSKMFESLYSRVLYHNPNLFDSTAMTTEQNFQSEDQWHRWLDAEARRRLLTACFITDVHTAAYQQQKRAHECDFTTEVVSPTVPLTARSAALWDASSAEEWTSILASDPEAGIPSFAQALDNLTAEDVQARPFFDQAAILALELVHLPRLLPTSAAPSSLSARDDDDLDPLIRPKSTPGYSTTTSPTNTTLHNLVFPISYPSAAHPSQPNPRSRTIPPKRTTEERISRLFPTCPRAATYLALHHTPLHDLLAVSGDTWIFSQKVLPATSFLEHQRRLKQWAEASTRLGRTTLPASGGPDSQAGLSAPQATIYAARAILAFLSRGGEEPPDDEDGSPSTASSIRSSSSSPAAWSVELSDYWALYVCALICWAFSHRARKGLDGKGGSGRGADGGGSGANSGSGSEGGEGRRSEAGRRGRGASDGEAMAWLRMVGDMSPEQVVGARGRREAGGVVGLVRRRLEWDCVGGRSRLYVDAVGVLKKLEEGVNWKWF